LFVLLSWHSFLFAWCDAIDGKFVSSIIGLPADHVAAL